MKLLFKRLDGTYVAEVKGCPYHVIPSDPMFDDTKAAADAMGASLQLETPPVPFVIPKKVDPDASQIKAVLKALGKSQAQIDALWTLALAI